MAKISIKKDVNLLLSYYKKPKKLEKKKTSIGKYVFLFFLLAGFTSVYLLYFFNTQKIKDETKNLEAYINNEQNIEAYRKSQQDITDISKSTSNYALLEMNLSDYIKTNYMNAENIASIIACVDSNSKITGISYSKEQGQVEVTVSAISVADVNIFVRKLLKIKCFESVNYTGYTIVPESGEYTFVLNAVFAKINPVK